MSTTRIYVVRPKKPGAETPRLVNAASRNAALRHVAASSLTVDVAGQNELVDLIGKGVKVEVPGLEATDDDKDGAQ